MDNQAVYTNLQQDQWQYWDKTQTVNHGASGSAVTAVPNTGYRFVKWSDGSTANPRTDTNVTGDISVTAEFAINTYTVTFDKNGGDTEANPQTKTVTHGGNVGTLLTTPPKQAVPLPAGILKLTAVVTNLQKIHR